METASFQTHKKTFSTIGLKENRITSTLTVFWNNNIPEFFYSQWSDSSISDNFVKNLLTLLSLASHKFSNSARLQVAFRSDTFTLFFKQPRKKCSFKSSIPDNIFSTTQSFNFIQRRKSWRQGSGVAWSHNCWTGDNGLYSKAVVFKECPCLSFRNTQRLTRQKKNRTFCTSSVISLR